MVSECHVCGQPLDDQDIINAGMEEICEQCWDERWHSSRPKDDSITSKSESKE